MLDREKNNRMVFVSRKHTVSIKLMACQHLSQVSGQFAPQEGEAAPNSAAFRVQKLSQTSRKMPDISAPLPSCPHLGVWELQITRAISACFALDFLCLFVLLLLFNHSFMEKKQSIHEIQIFYPVFI